MVVKNILFSCLIFILFQNYCLSDDQVKRVWPHLFLTKGTDYQEISDLMSQRKAGYLKGMMDVLVKSMEKIHEGEGFASKKEMLTAILTISGLSIGDLPEANKLIPSSLSVNFSTNLMQLYKKQNIPLERRKFVFTHDKLIDFIVSNGVKNIPTMHLKMDADYVLIGEYLIVNRKDLKLIINLIDLKTGLTIGGFTVDASPANLAVKLAQAVFNFFQKNQSPVFENPVTGLTWILEPVSEAFKKEVSKSQAQTYCASQKYRLPYAEELIQLLSGGNGPSGFELIRENNSCYFVADNKDTSPGNYAKGAYHYYVSLDENRLYNGEIQEDAVLGGEQKCYFVCVKGEVAITIDVINKLYQIHRSESINGIRVDDNIRSLTKYLIYKLDPNLIFSNSVVNQSWGKYYHTPEDGINALKKAGYF